MLTIQGQLGPGAGTGEGLWVQTQVLPQLDTAALARAAVDSNLETWTTGPLWFSTFHFYFVLVCKFVELNHFLVEGKGVFCSDVSDLPYKGRAGIHTQVASVDSTSPHTHTPTHHDPRGSAHHTGCDLKWSCGGFSYFPIFRASALAPFWPHPQCPQVPQSRVCEHGHVAFCMR